MYEKALINLVFWSYSTLESRFVGDEKSEDDQSTSWLMQSLPRKNY
jgi:hypothetical protein